MKVGTDAVLLGAWVQLRDSRFALDIGTGTGLIAMMIAQRNKDLKVRAIDIHEPSVCEALYNFSRSPFWNRLEALETSVQDYAILMKKKYDLIISNPPFFLEGTRSKSLKRDQARHTQSLSFDSLLLSVKRLLSEKGTFALILPEREGSLFLELAIAEGLYCTRYCEVRSLMDKPVERLLMEFGRTKKSTKKESLVINKDTGRNNWTDDYQALTRAFHTII